MKKLLFILIFGITIQIHSQIQVNLYFFDECNNKIEKLEFDLFNLDNEKEFLYYYSKGVVDSIGTYIVNSEFIIGDYRAAISDIIEIKKNENFTDTISVPKIRFRTESALHSDYWNYYYCDKICNGKETDYYSNGNKRLEGIFKNGKPIEIIEFRENGTKSNKEFYDYGMLSVNRLEYYNEKGELYEYEIHKLKKRKTIIKVYDSSGNLLRKKIEKHYIE